MSNPICSLCQGTGRDVQFSIFSKHGFGKYCATCEADVERERANQQRMRTQPATGFPENYSEHGAGAAHALHTEEDGNS